MPENIYRRIYFTGLLCYAALFILSIIFYKERTVFTDIAYHLFFIVKKADLAIQNFRFGAACTQVFPLLGVKAGMGLNTLLYIYSSCFIFFYFICYIICGSVVKNYPAAIVLLVFNILFVSDTFYWIQSELPQSIALMCVFWSMFNKYGLSAVTKPLPIAIYFLLIFTITFTHPLMLFAFSFCLLFFYLQHKQKSYVTIGAFFVGIYLIKNIAFKTAYDTSATPDVLEQLKEMRHFFSLESNRRFAKLLLFKYYWIPLLSIPIVVHYLRRRSYLQLGLFLAYMVGYTLLVNLSYPTYATATHYIENLYLPLGIFIALPLLYDVLPTVKSATLVYGITIGVMITAAIRIYYTHHSYTERLNWERTFLAQHIDEKLIISDKKIPREKLIMTWGTPYEFWLLSTTEKGKTASLLISDNVPSHLWAKDDNKAFITMWEVFQYNDLPKAYFKLDDTTTAYQVIE